MIYKTNESKDNLEIKLEGDVDLYNAFDITKIIKEKLSKNSLNVEIDLEAVNFIDSAGMSMLIEAKTQACLKEMTVIASALNIR